MRVDEFWAKTNPYQSVITHGIISGKVAAIIVRYYLSDGENEYLQKALQMDAPQMESFLSYLASVHDIGKIEYNFQAKDHATKETLDCDPENRRIIPKKNVRHEKAGQKVLCSFWNHLGEDEDAADLFSEIIGAHHQGKHGGPGYPVGKSWTDMQLAFEKQMRTIFLPDSSDLLPICDDTIQGAVGAILLSLIVLSDWIASGTVFADAEEWIHEKNADARITETALAFLRESGLEPVRMEWPDGFSALWPFIPPDGQRMLQKKTAALFQTDNTPICALLLEAPMGEGKTEAGVFAAIQMAKQWGKDGFYIALPTAATSNQMVERMRKLLSLHDVKQKVRLLHAMAWMENAEAYCKNDAEDANDAASWLAPVKRGLLGQFAVGTVDQAMLAATTVKYGALRLLGLSNKVLVIDEIHSYDAYMSAILKRLLEWCKALKIPVVMLSATLPPAKKAELFRPFAKQAFSGSYPLITAIRADGKVEEIPIEKTSHCLSARSELLPFLGDPAKIAEVTINLVSDGGCVCVLMNTVKEAQAVYQELKTRWTGDLILFHAQFTAQRRAELEEACIRRYGKDRNHRPARSILVATQVVEQSLDVDFDAMITAIAPIDLVLQRLGRVHRHEDTPRPDALLHPLIKILIPGDHKNFGASKYVYPECLLRSAIRVLEGKSFIRIPEDLAQLVQDGYDPANVPQDELSQWMEKQVRDQVEAGASQAWLINSPDQTYNALYDSLVYEDDDRTMSAATRLGEPTIRLALLSEKEYRRLEPFLHTQNGKIVADVRQKSIAEMVMRQTVSVRISRLGKELSNLWYIYGDKLLSGLWIMPLEDGKHCLENGKLIQMDQELGLLIKEGEV